MSVAQFLTDAGWDGARRRALAGDASSRRYERLTDGARSAILMIDPEDDTQRFAHVADYLRGIGLSAPAILARAPGLMLLEDFGDESFARKAREEPGSEEGLYRTAAAALAHLHGFAPAPHLACATPGQLAGMIAPVFDCYVSAIGAETETARTGLISRFHEALEKALDPPRVTILRDFHAENLIWLKDRVGVRRVGLLDFQDAMQGDPAYDLVSLLQDARRDVPSGVARAAIGHFIDLSGTSEARFMTRFHLLGLQRNLRILGIFARLATQAGKTHYLGLMPRVWKHVAQSLDMPAARSLAPLIRDNIPEPTPERLRQLRETCPTPR